VTSPISRRSDANPIAGSAADRSSVPRRLLVDTDVLIDYLRERQEAVDYLESRREPLVTSAIVAAELFAGVRDGAERDALESLLEAFEVVPIDAQIAERGGLWRRDYAPTHGVGLADALIAATADRANAALVTLNDKHFPMLRDVVVPYAKS